MQLLVLILLSFAATPMFGQDTLLGALEDVPGNSADDPNSYHVRVIFQKHGTSWQAFPSSCHDRDCLRKAPSAYPDKVDWTVGFDGRILGQVTAQTPADFETYSHIGLQNVIHGDHIPTVGTRSAQYGGYIDAVVYRPLIANSKPFFKDPELWKVSHLSPEAKRLFRRGFRQHFSRLCKSSVRDEDKLEQFVYRDEDVKLVKAYISKNQWAIARLHLQGAVDCTNLEAGSEIDDAWFVMDPQKSVRYIGEGMWLVDAGDYDNDSRSELLFSINRENRGGYELFYDNFKRKALFEFEYH